MKVGRSPEGKWLVLEGKEVLQTFNTREEAIAVLKGSVIVVAEPAELKLTTQAPVVHVTQGKDVVALGPDRLNQGWIGRRCSCGDFHIRDTGEVVAMYEYEGGIGTTPILLYRPR